MPVVNAAPVAAPRPHPRVDTLPRYQPGRSEATVRAAHGLDSVVKLASNEAPFGPLPGVAEAVAASLARSHRYADHVATTAVESFADSVGVDPTRVAAGPGSVGLLEQLALAYAGPGDHVVYPWPSFIAYPQFTALSGATAVAVPLRRQRFDAEAVVAAVDERTRLVLLANANNPTSTALTGGELRHIVDNVPDDCLVVVDEAYHEFATGTAIPDAIDLFGDRPNVAVLRTLSKAYGMAGLRVGFIVAHPEVVDAVAACATPFGVNRAGQAGAIAALEQHDEVARRCAVVTGERQRVAHALRERGIGVLRSHGNFWWLPAGVHASALSAALEERGVITRPLDGGVRVTVGLPDENDRFLDTLDAVLGPDPSTSSLLADWGVATGDAARKANAWLDRLDSVMTRLGEHVALDHPGRTAPVPGEAETWDAGQVWAHLAEFGAYWIAELEPLLDASSSEPLPFGRTRRDAGRIAAIEAGRHGEAADHLETVEEAAERLGQLLSGMTTQEWSLSGRHETLGVLDLDAQLTHFHVGHLEEHADQLDSIR